MRYLRTVMSASALALVVTVGATLPTGTAEADGAMSLADKGKSIALNKKTGNCIACHQFAGGKLAGNIGPPLIAMKARFPDKAKLRALIWDMAERNPHAMMPRFGKYRMLSESDIDALTEFVHGL